MNIKVYQCPFFDQCHADAGPQLYADNEILMTMDAKPPCKDGLFTYKGDPMCFISVDTEEVKTNKDLKKVFRHVRKHMF